MARGVGRAVSDPRTEYAYQLRISLLEVIAPHRLCAGCGAQRELEDLEVSYRDGSPWRAGALSAWGRAERYWADLDVGVRLQALCRSCVIRGGDWPGRGRRKPGEWQGPLWAWASFELVQRLYRAARKATPWPGGTHGDILSVQPWARRVSAEFGRRLAAAHIWVEGLTA